MSIVTADGFINWLTHMLSGMNPVQVPGNGTNAVSIMIPMKNIFTGGRKFLNANSFRLILEVEGLPESVTSLQSSDILFAKKKSDGKFAMRMAYTDRRSFRGLEKGKYIDADLRKRPFPEMITYKKMGDNRLQIEIVLKRYFEHLPGKFFNANQNLLGIFLMAQFPFKTRFHKATLVIGQESNVGSRLRSEINSEGENDQTVLLLLGVALLLGVLYYRSKR